ncbi:hypothetical protein Tco_1377350 [Tanacetum coccineum]
MVWGCRAVVRLPDPKMKTLGERGNECIFVGYAKNFKAFKFYVIEPNEFVLINCINESRDAILDENRFSSIPKPKQRSLINRTDDDIGVLEVLDKDSKEVVVQQPELRKEAVNDEMDSIMGNNTWVLADLPGFKLSGYKWIFKRKLQAPKKWHQKFDEVVLSSGYLLTKLINVYIENLMKLDMGEVDVILGIRIKHESNSLSISQSHYIKKVLRKFNYFDCIPVSTPMDTSEKLRPNNGQVVSQLEYSRVIACLMYVMTCTRPDIAFVVGKMSMYTSDPSTQHWQAVQRVLKYLKKTMDYIVSYIRYPSFLEGYTNANWISNTEDNSSTSGWVFFLGEGAISWASKKQTCITSSTMASEFVALVAAGKEAKWLRNVILEISLWSKPISPISICCDNAAALVKAYCQMYNGKSRHLGVKHSMICELHE